MKPLFRRTLTGAFAGLASSYPLAATNAAPHASLLVGIVL